ncbi:Calmodulin-like protein [Mycena chlorophos]|uniref:Calmodulin-like protein n=1 Tax=Mycena chlorophos TaxID=658473 RepID=A0A8H6TAG4_MYCCL|nr:Calmodulin-like protein [Mycena chlorophos]
MSTPQSSTDNVHPSAVGRNSVPDTTEPRDSGDSGSKSASQGPDAAEYPEQRHAGAVGFGPNYHAQPGFLDKLTAAKETVTGKVTRNPELAEKGHDRWTGALKQKELDADQAEDPFANPEEKRQEQEQKQQEQTDGDARASRSQSSSSTQ